MEPFLRLLAVLENSVAAFAGVLPFGYAFGAGMVAAVNPCGFFMLPAFGSYYLGLDVEQQSAAAPLAKRVLQAVLLGTMATLGFIALFGLVGLLIALGGQWVVRLFPWAGLTVGAVLLALGLWMLLTHRTIGLWAASRVEAPLAPGLRNVFLFGVAYGIASLACTLPIFLLVVGSSLVTRGFVASLGQFISYGLGMGTLLTAVTISVALFKGALVAWLRQLLPAVHRLSAALMALAGAFIVAYWLFYGPWRL